MKTKLFAALFLLSASAAHADSSALEQSKQHYQQADADEKVGAYDDAIREFAAAYDAAPLPAFLFNLAHCYRLKGDNDKALVYYEKFLALAPNTPPFSDQARQQVARLRLLEETAKAQEAKRQAEETERQEASQKAEREARQRAEAESARLAAEARTRQVAMPRPDASPLIAASDTPPSSLSLRNSGIALLIVGGAALVGGATLVGLAGAGANSVNSSSDLTNRDRRIANVQAEQIIGGVTLGVGGAALVTGLALYLKSRHAAFNPRPLRHAMWFAPSGNGLQVGGEF